MESHSPMDEESGTRRGSSPNDREGVRFAEAVVRILAADSISRKELEEDGFLGEETVEEYLQRAVIANRG